MFKKTTMFDAPALPVQHWAPEERGHSERLAPAAGRNGEKIATNGSGGKRGVYIGDSSPKLQSLRKIKGSVPYHGYH
jgi:hypothetical protein